ncbi:ATP-binding cassette sub-family G member 1-like [Oppia nitens]|uniref:ATP-binding cassette sub-family G member 1-like n=1 Tax=Oppia nitens TaxID=1686743 RepID=UPI0023DA0086|nr:ATP-binding cassette sub-family G member 1-like [Oppia nitens]
MVNNKNELALAWINLSYTHKGVLINRKETTILQALNGQINFYEITALMGPSGAGKTTLLKCVNMRQQSGLSSNSQIFVNKYIPLRTCFIMQSSDEHLLMGLTVRESLLFASKIKNRVTTGRQYRDSCVQTGDSLLCLESDNSGLTYDSNDNIYDDFNDTFNSDGNFDHNLNINKIMSELLLSDCADTTVQKCSGGEQKRLSVGLELVQQIKPNLLCIDEPTSGLDSNASELVIQCLKQLSVLHRMAIVTSIHQPNSLLLDMFDQLYVLAKGGQCVYTGPPNQLRQHLLDCNIICPQEVLPIELLLKISSNATKNISSIKSDKNKCNKISSLSMFERNAVEIRKLLDKTNKSTQEIQDICRLNGKLVSKVVDKHSVGFSFYNMYYLLFRGITCFIKHDYILGIGLLVMALFIASCLCYFYGMNVGYEDSCLNITMFGNSTSTKHVSLDKAMKIIDQDLDVIQNIKCQFFAITTIGFITMACSILSFPQEVRVFLNEHKNKWYSTGSYYWAKSLTDLPMTVTVAIIYSIIMYYGTGQLNEMIRYCYYTIITIILMLISNSFGNFIGILFARNFQLATSIGVASFLVVFLLGGFAVRLSTADLVLRGFSYVSFIKFAFNCIIIVIYGMDRCGVNFEGKILILDQFDVNDDHLWTNMYWLLDHYMCLHNSLIIGMSMDLVQLDLNRSLYDQGVDMGSKVDIDVQTG